LPIADCRLTAEDDFFVANRRSSIDDQKSAIDNHSSTIDNHQSAMVN